MYIFALFINDTGKGLILISKPRFAAAPKPWRIAFASGHRHYPNRTYEVVFISFNKETV